MKKEEFHQRFHAAKTLLWQFTGEMILEILPEAAVYYFTMSRGRISSSDLSDLGWDERIYKRDERYTGEQLHGPFSETEYLKEVWRDEYVPRWVDLSVDDIRQDKAVIYSCSSDVFTKYDQEGNPYYTERRFKPWGVKSPNLPLGWKSVDSHGKFSIHRRRKKSI